MNEVCVSSILYLHQNVSALHRLINHGRALSYSCSVVELSNAPMCPVFAKLWEEMS